MEEDEEDPGRLVRDRSKATAEKWEKVKEAAFGGRKSHDRPPLLRLLGVQVIFTLDDFTFTFSRVF